MVELGIHCGVQEGANLEGAPSWGEMGGGNPLEPLYMVVCYLCDKRTNLCPSLLSSAPSPLLSSGFWTLSLKLKLQLVGSLP